MLLGGAFNILDSMMSSVSTPAAAAAAASKPIGSTPRGSGLDMVPPQYTRRQMSQEEMEFIEVCH